jgi:cytochrome c
MRIVTIVAGAFAISAAFAGQASAQDAAAGERLFNQCRTCHQVGESAKNTLGPHLNGIFENRKAGSVEGYSYSNAYKAIADKVWSVENFTTYIKDPRGVTPGTKMVYAGMKDEGQIKNLIAFLQQFGPDGKKK